MVLAAAVVTMLHQEKVLEEALLQVKEIVAVQQSIRMELLQTVMLLVVAVLVLLVEVLHHLQLLQETGEMDLPLLLQELLLLAVEVGVVRGLHLIPMMERAEQVVVVTQKHQEMQEMVW